MGTSSTDKRDSGSPFGVLTFISWNHDWNNFFYSDDAKMRQAAVLMRDAGIRFARMDFLWADLEPHEGKFDFTHQDRAIHILAEQGISILGILNYNPLWRNQPWNVAPEDDAFIRYAQAVVGHYKDHVKYWEVWNEPDHPDYWAPQDDLTAYSRLLKAVYQTIKAEDPTALVLTGGLVDGGTDLRKIYQKAGRDAFDIVNLHPFVNPLDPHALDQLRLIHSRVRDVMTEFGDSQKPIWLTEIGCPGTNSGSPAGWWLGDVPTEDQQAAWLNTIYNNALQWEGVKKVFWAFLRDTDRHFKNDTDHFGILRLDFSPKPAYLAYKKLTVSSSVPA